jgi:predicted site-specific integrase-resolvase
MRRHQGRWFKPVDLAEYYRLNVKTVYRRVKSGDLPAIRLPNGQLRIPADDAIVCGRRIAIGAHRNGARPVEG